MRVLISGYYGFGNLGDEALLSGMIRSLNACGHKVRVLSQDPGQTRTLHQVDAASRLTGLAGALWRCDALVSGGGGLLQDRSSRRSLLYYLNVLRLAKLFGKKAVVFGQSVGPLSSWGQDAVRATLEGIPVAVRDEGSRKLLAELGLDAHLTADASLLLEAPEVPVSEDGVLLIPRGGYPELTPRLAEAASRLVGDGRPVWAMALQEDEDGPEVDALVRLAEGVRAVRARTPQEALERIGAAGYVISARLHGLILAAVAGRGMSGIVYDPKVASFLAEAGAPAHPLLADPARLYVEARARPALDVARIGRLKERAKGGIDWLDEAISARGRGVPGQVQGR